MEGVASSDGTTVTKRQAVSTHFIAATLLDACYILLSYNMKLSPHAAAAAATKLDHGWCTTVKV
jgi:hypothetical protein